MNAEKVNRVNKAFVDIQKELANFSKGLSLEPLQKQLVSGNCFLLSWPGSPRVGVAVGRVQPVQSHAGAETPRLSVRTHRSVSQGVARS